MTWHTGHQPRRESCAADESQRRNEPSVGQRLDGSLFLRVQGHAVGRRPQQNRHDAIGARVRPSHLAVIAVNSHACGR